jgi:hypothetical protein
MSSNARIVLRKVIFFGSSAPIASSAAFAFAIASFVDRAISPGEFSNFGSLNTVPNLAAFRCNSGHVSGVSGLISAVRPSTPTMAMRNKLKLGIFIQRPIGTPVIALKTKIIDSEKTERMLRRFKKNNYN